MNDKEDLTPILKYMCSCGLSSFLLDLNDLNEVESFGLFVSNIDSRESMNIFTHLKRLNCYFFYTLTKTFIQLFLQNIHLLWKTHKKLILLILYS